MVRASLTVKPKYSLQQKVKPKTNLPKSQFFFLINSSSPSLMGYYTLAIELSLLKKFQQLVLYHFIFFLLDFFLVSQFLLQNKGDLFLSLSNVSTKTYKKITKKIIVIIKVRSPSNPILFACTWWWGGGRAIVEWMRQR